MGGIGQSILKTAVGAALGLSAIGGIYFGTHYVRVSPADDRLRWAVAQYLMRREIRGRTIPPTGLTIHPAGAEQVAEFLGGHPDCCRIVARSEAAPTDDEQSWLFDPFGHYVHVSDGSYRQYVYVPGSVN